MQLSIARPSIHPASLQARRKSYRQSCNVVEEEVALQQELDSCQCHQGVDWQRIVSEHLDEEQRELSSSSACARHHNQREPPAPSRTLASKRAGRTHLSDEVLEHLAGQEVASGVAVGVGSLPASAAI